MENYFKIINKDETIAISIAWDSSASADDRQKLHKIIVSAIEFWQPEEKTNQ